MKIKNDFVLREVAGQNIVVPVGEATANFDGMITLNESGAFLWEALKADTNEEQLLEALLGEYDVSEETAKADIKAFVEKMREAKLLDE